MMAKDWRLAVLAVYALSMGVMLIDAQSTVLNYAMLLWCLLPIAILCFTPKWPTELGITAILIGFFGFWVVFDALYIFIPRSIPLFAIIFLPIAQSVAAPLFFGIAKMITKNFGEQ